MRLAGKKRKNQGDSKPREPKRTKQFIFFHTIFQLLELTGPKNRNSLEEEQNKMKDQTKKKEQQPKRNEKETEQQTKQNETKGSTKEAEQRADYKKQKTIEVVDLTAICVCGIVEEDTNECYVAKVLPPPQKITNFFHKTK